MKRMICAKCGTPLSLKADACTHCGNQINERELKERELDSTRRGGKIIWFTALALVIGGMGILIFGIRHHNDDIAFWGRIILSFGFIEMAVGGFFASMTRG